MKAPNFFVIGAAKAGTTSLCHYLGEHARIFIPPEKELRYFCGDFDSAEHGEATARYLEYFEKAGDEHIAVGEGSVLYLPWAPAVPRILEFDPLARFIVILRSPVEIARAWHSQMHYIFAEDVEDFETAWALQGERAAGRNIPKGIGWPWRLQYREMFLLGEQIERLCSRVPRERVHICYTEDMAADPGAVYRGALSFLGVEDDGRSEFPVMNRNRVYRNEALGKLAWRPSPRRKRIAKRVKRALGLQDVEVLEFLRRANRKEVRRAEMNPETRSMLVEAFREDVGKLEKILDRDFQRWL